jgi:hypothetical protein
MQLVTELDRDLQVASIIVKVMCTYFGTCMTHAILSICCLLIYAEIFLQNGRRFLARATFEVSQDLVVAANVRKKQVLLVNYFVLLILFGTQLLVLTLVCHLFENIIPSSDLGKIQDMDPVLERVHQALDIKSRLDSVVDEGNFCKVSFLNIR